MILKEITDKQISKEIEKALNAAINKLGVEEELVFETIKVSPKEEIKKNCRMIRKCKVQGNGKLVCKWVKKCD